MSKSNFTDNSPNTSLVIQVNGMKIPDEIIILSILIEKKVNGIPITKIVILDGISDAGAFTVSSSSVFLPGSVIKIEAGYDSINEVIFEGIITGQSIRIDSSIGSAIEVECHDPSIAMAVGRKSISYSNKKDSEIIASIIATYSGLKADVAVTTAVWPEQVQYYVTDWDYILNLAEANGLVVTVINGKIAVNAPDKNTASVLTVTYGEDLYEFNAKLNAITQLGSVSSKSWDYKNQEILNMEAFPTISSAGNLSTKKLSEVIGLSSYQQQTDAPLDAVNLGNWSKAQIIKSEYSKILGVAKIQGTNLVNPGKYITFNGLGDRFNGDYFIGGIKHDLANGGWFTEINLGLSPHWITEKPDAIAPSASGLIPPAKGLFNGTVKEIFDDPEAQYRILVDIPLFNTNGNGIWARLSNFYATNGAGAFFLPEVGDEVILGFLNEDPRYPIILGSLYSASKKPFHNLAPSENNSIKAIISKSGISVAFDDENKIWTVTTPNSNTIIISDKNQQITIKDENQNSIIMSSSGIDISSQKSINILAQESVTIKGTQGVHV
jgi:Rhs element Vgr protein